MDVCSRVLIFQLLLTTVVLGGVPLSRAESDIYYLHTDHLGTPHLVTDQNQQVVWKAHYRPFGEATLEVASIDMPLRFPGQYYDKETGLHYNYFRDYDPALGRYLQSDPLGLIGGLDTYGYAFQNPLRYVDPTGLIAWDCVSFKTAAGVHPLDFGQIIFTCRSECVEGRRTVAQIQVLFTGPGFGVGVEITGSKHRFTDGNATPRPSVFDGLYTEVSAGASYGFGYGFGMGSFNRGAVKGSLSGVQAGIGVGLGEASGTSRVVWAREEVCRFCED